MFNLNFSQAFQIITQASQKALNQLTKNLKPSIQQQNQNKSLSPFTATILPKRPQNHKSIGRKQGFEQKITISDKGKSQGCELGYSQKPIQQKTENFYEDADAFAKASNLILKMNQRRKIQSEMKKKNEVTLRNKILDSLKQFEELNDNRQKEKEQKRHQISKRIFLRRNQSKLRQEFSKKSNHLINELTRNSLKNLSYDLHNNPEAIQEVDNTITPKSTNKNVYLRSPFLERLQKEQLIRKKSQLEKNIEKKKVRERQKNYSKLIRKPLKQSSVFVTD